MKIEELDLIYKQTLIDASKHHEEERVKYFNLILKLVNDYKHLQHKLAEMVKHIGDI